MSRFEQITCVSELSVLCLRAGCSSITENFEKNYEIQNLFVFLRYRMFFDFLKSIEKCLYYAEYYLGLRIENTKLWKLLVVLNWFKKHIICNFKSSIFPFSWAMVNQTKAKSKVYIFEPRTVEHKNLEH